ncbi:MAG: hypothetical protein Q8R28_15075 [Dehalococcoidia bacterium]|nr:hypothetical protein [Dehalococcoidia bacterium]
MNRTEPDGLSEIVTYARGLYDEGKLHWADMIEVDRYVGDTLVNRSGGYYVVRDLADGRKSGVIPLLLARARLVLGHPDTWGHSYDEGY